MVLHLHVGPPWVPGSFVDRLSPAARDDLLRIGTTRELPPGHTLFLEGDRDTHAEVIVRGYAKITMGDADGNEVLMAIRTPGDMVGELAAMSGQPRSATVTACGVVISCVVTRSNLHAYLERHPEAGRHLTAVVGDRLRWANLRRLDFAAHAVGVRVARVLSELARTCGTATAAGVVLSVTLTQPELASMVGASEVAVHRALHDLRGAGLVQTGYRRFTITRAESLLTYGAV